MARHKFLQLIYRMPTKPTAGRVAVWRSLKKAGAVYLQDSACVLPDTDEIRAELDPVLKRIDASCPRRRTPSSSSCSSTRR
jgi:hypothetical protein